MKKKILILVSVAVILAGAIAVTAVIGNVAGGKFPWKDNKAVLSEKTTTGTENNSVESTLSTEKTQSTESTKASETQATSVTEETSAESTETKIDVSDTSDKDVKKVKVKAIYLSGMSAGSTKVLDHYIDVINKTELNAVVIDVKEGGIVNYASSVPDVVKYKLYARNFNAEKVLKKLHDNNIYVIGRIVCFRDNGLALKRPDLAVKKLDGSIWTEGSQGAWTNAYKEEVWQYNIDIAKEAIEKGFDEIQFDYVRFPTASSKKVSYGSNPSPKTDAITNFLKKANEELHNGLGVPVSADVFGIIAESPTDAKSIGQKLEEIVKYIDCISPMVYPSHYSNAAKSGALSNGQGQIINGVPFTAPDLKPYDVVYNTLLGIKKVIDKVEGDTATVRPYLQDFTASYLPKGYYQVYGVQQVKQQIKAVQDAGYEEWILWDGKNTYTEGALAAD